ncbi:hypothetical protein P5673_006452 [Acropora cervicornis]|uniref:Uncharacterized protein n=1 Tax=Acropora cervicornis TaxID=6130 RepID=A0AAD9VBL6_ACRCE|nr:hypothetical protein P5673_006452 [Acropora cervicornis]
MEPQKLVRSGAERDPLDGSPNNKINNLMSENQVYFFLHFVRELGTPAPELIVRGGERDPLDCLLTIAEVSNYDEAMKDPDFELESRYDFILNDNGEIIHQLSNESDKINLEENAAFEITTDNSETNMKNESQFLASSIATTQLQQGRIQDIEKEGAGH